MPYSVSSDLLLDPSPSDWLTSERIANLHKALMPSADLLFLSGHLNAILNYWLRLQIANEALDCEEMWPSVERDVELDHAYADWISKYNLKDFSLTEEQLRTKLLVKPGSYRWASFHWKYKLESLFLDQKESLDQASCRLLRHADKHMALEIYHRAMACEESFDVLATQFGEGPERIHGGLVPLQPLYQLPLGLNKVLPNLIQDEIMPPRPISNGYVLVQLLEWRPAIFDETTQRSLIKKELNAWLEEMVLILVKDLGLRSVS